MLFNNLLLTMFPVYLSNFFFFLFAKSKSCLWGFVTCRLICSWFRCIPNVLGWSNYNFIGANTIFPRGSNYDIWGLKLRCEFSTGSFYKRSRFSPLASRYIGSSCSLLDIRRGYASQASREQKSWKMLSYLTALVFAMVGCTYASVPLYRRFCQATGYGGTTQRREVWLNLFPHFFYKKNFICLDFFINFFSLHISSLIFLCYNKILLSVECWRKDSPAC